MAHTQLIVGGTETKRLKLVNQIVKKTLGITFPAFHPDLIIVQGKNSISIDQTRELKAKLILKPYQSSIKLALVLQADKLTLAAQNSLLKTLEEPPAKSQIVLETANPSLLLPTIVSRCQIIKLDSLPSIQPDKTQMTNYQQLIMTLLKSGVGERLKLAAAYAQNREQTLESIQFLLLAWRQLIQKNPSQAFSRNIRLTQKALEMLKANTQPGLTLGNLFLNYSSCTEKKI